MRPPPAKRPRGSGGAAGAAAAAAASTLSPGASRPPSLSQRARAAAVTGIPNPRAGVHGSGSGSGEAGEAGEAASSPRPGSVGGSSASSLAMEEEEEPVPDVMRNVFSSASLAELRLAIERAGIYAAPSPTNENLRPYMNFSILVRAPAMLSKVFEMVSAVLNRSGGRESKGSIGFTVVMLNGSPHLAVDVGDETYTFIASVRVATEVHVHPDFQGHAGQFPVFRVSCKSMVDKLNQVKDFKRVMIYQQRTSEDQLEIMIDMPNRPGDVQIETVKIQADEWASLRLEDITHNYTLQMSIKSITQKCKMQHDSSGSLTLSIYQREQEEGTSGGGEGPGGSGSGVRQRQSYILKLEAVNAAGETSSTLRPIVNELETMVDPETGEETTTMHFSEGSPTSGLDLLENLHGCTLRFSQSFASGQIEAFLSKWEPNKMITMRLAKDQPMVMSYNYGNLVICQMVTAPQVDVES